MGYYMRFISTDQRQITVPELRDALVAADSGYDIEIDDSVVTIRHSGDTIAQLEINVPGDGLFEEERDELVEFVTDAPGEQDEKARVLDALARLRTIVAAQVLFGTGNTDDTLLLLDPLWTWLLQNRNGLLQADGEGYYDADGLVVKID